MVKIRSLLTNSTPAVRYEVRFGKKKKIAITVSVAGVVAIGAVIAWMQGWVQF
jgi:hypothetical protein